MNWRVAVSAGEDVCSRSVARYAHAGHLYFNVQNKLQNVAGDLSNSLCISWPD